jgi:SAM-dependent methyltransferase
MTAPCALCGSTDGTTLHTAEGTGYGYVRCAGCGTGRIDPMPKPAVLDELYGEGYFVDGGPRGGYEDYEADAPLHRRTARRRLRSLRGALPRHDHRPRRLVDVGSGTGYVVAEAARAGWDVVAVERSGWAAERIRDRGVPVVADLAAAPFGPGTVDAVTFYQSLEHLPDPAAALEAAAGLLRPGGVVVCETWDLDSRTARAAGRLWHQFSPPSVLWLFDPASGARLVRRAGLEPVSWRLSPKVVSLASAAGHATARMPAPLRAAVRLARPLTTRMPLPYALDDLVTFVARRAG